MSYNDNDNYGHLDCECIHKEVCRYKIPMIESISVVSKVSLESYIIDIQKLCKYRETPIKYKKEKKK